MTLDKQITIGFLIMLAIIILVSGFCMYTISELKHTRTSYGDKQFSFSEIISAFSEEENESGVAGIFGTIVGALVLLMPWIGAVSKAIWANFFFKFDQKIAEKARQVL